jgi:hypothetical protein
MPTMLNIKRILLLFGTAVIAARGASEKTERQPASAAPAQIDNVIWQNADRMLAEGLRTFRFDTFGSEDF